MLSAGGPAPRHHHNVDGRLPARPPWWNFPLSLIWALAPLYTAGFVTPFIIGHAAVQLKSRIAGFATGVYGVILLAFVVISGIYSDNDPATKEAPVEVITGIMIVVNWLGGTVHAFALRSSAFRSRSMIHPPPRDWQYNPMPPPRYRAPTHPTSPYRAHPTPPPTSPYQAPASRAYQAYPSPAPAPPPSSPPVSISPFSPSPRYPANTASGSLPFGEIGPYRLDRKIGAGGQGAVYLAYGPGGLRVAVKVLHSRIIGGAAERESFVREAAMAQRVRPFATAKVIDVGVMGDVAYIVSEYVPGPSLERLVRREGPRDGDSLTRLAIGTAGALAGIHAAGIVHRDFKPANVLLGPDGPRVIDFGIARALDQVTMTSGVLKGTMAYMSPEQISGEHVGPASDVFSWAATMLFGATGRHAFDAGSTPLVYRKIITHHPDLSVLPTALQAPLAACLAKDPGGRPTAAEAMTLVTS
ncbi:protein kinase [Streptosporangium sp. NPDC006930]|uniref:protein kinase domain-containing protein n=1 Tax=Streptosporangium sp. NPDC006930 TaxID=3154783 RepID=UPI00343BE066